MQKASTMQAEQAAKKNATYVICLYYLEGSDIRALSDIKDSTAGEHFDREYDVATKTAKYNPFAEYRMQ